MKAYKAAPGAVGEGHETGVADFEVALALCKERFKEKPKPKAPKKAKVYKALPASRRRSRRGEEEEKKKEDEEEEKHEGEAALEGDEEDEEKSPEKQGEGGDAKKGPT